MRSVVFLQFIGVLILNGCGSESDSSPMVLAQNLGQSNATVAILKTDPVILAFERSSENSSVINPVNRVLDLLAYDQLIAESLSPDKKYSNYLVTGIGLEAAVQVMSNGELTNVSLPIRMALRAREWDSKTQTFGANAQVFGVQGVSLESAQEFSLLDPSSSNFVMTGLGLKLREGRFTKLELKRSTLANIMTNSFETLTALNRIELPPGWAAVGLIVAVDRANSTTPVRDPFVEDIRLYSGWVGPM